MESEPEEILQSNSAPSFHTVDLKDSVAYGLINDLEKLNKVC